MKKKTKIIFWAVCGILIVFLGLNIIRNNDDAERKTYEGNWRIVLPANQLQKEFSAQSEENFHNDGYLYTIFTLKDKNAVFLRELSSQKNKEMQNVVTEGLDSLKIEHQRYPNFSHDYQWKMLSRDSGYKKLYIIYDPDSSQVYFLQDLL